MLHYCDWRDRGGGALMAAVMVTVMVVAMTWPPLVSGYLGSNPVVAAIDFANEEDTAVFVLSLEGDAENNGCSASLWTLVLGLFLTTGLTEVFGLHLRVEG